VDLFEKLLKDRGPLGQHSKEAHGYFTFPKLEGEIAPRMKFRGKEVLTWSLNNYLGLANHPEIRKTDTEATAQWGMAYPMGARMMTGNTQYHEELEQKLAAFVEKEDCVLFNFGYQGIMSAIDCLVDRHDVIVYDSLSHACIIDGVRLHMGKRFVFPHNDIVNLEKQLQRAQKIVEQTGGAILLITEGVFGMSGTTGKLREIIALKEKYQFRLLVDDAHGFGTMGTKGAGTGEFLNCQEGIDLYFSTFAKSMASIGAFMAADAQVCDFIRYNIRSQIFAKSLPMPIVVGALKRLELLQSQPALKENLWKIVNALQDGLKARGFNIGNTESPVTPVYMAGGKGEATRLAMDLRENFGIFCSVVAYPVVPKDVIILRLIPTAMHSLADVEETLAAFEKVGAKLQAGAYKGEDIAVLK
jgi:glycine C-acetyltransferase